MVPKVIVSHLIGSQMLTHGQCWSVLSTLLGRGSGFAKGAVALGSMPWGVRRVGPGKAWGGCA